MQGNADSWATTIPLRHREEVAPRAPTEQTFAGIGLGFGIYSGDS